MNRLSERKISTQEEDVWIYAGRWEEISAWEMHVHKVNLWFGGPKEGHDVNHHGGLCSVGTLR